MTAAETAPPNSSQPQQWQTRTYFLSLLGILVAIGLVARFFPPHLREAAWIIILVLMSLFVILFGHSVTGTWKGALIDRRNCISLSRLQMLGWSLLVLSGLLTAALTNLVAYGSSTPLNIDIPGSLWVLMGISSASLVGSPAITANKEETATTIETKRSPTEARFSDLFMSEEKGTQGVVDVGKLQMFFFTFILLLTYGAAIGGKLAPEVGIVRAFPPVDEGINVLLGISHTGYLSTKALGKTRKPQPPATANEEEKS